MSDASVKPTDNHHRANGAPSHNGDGNGNGRHASLLVAGLAANGNPASNGSAGTRGSNGKPPTPPKTELAAMERPREGGRIRDPGAAGGARNAEVPLRGPSSSVAVNGQADRIGSSDPSTHPAHVAAVASERVMESFQRTMREFLDVQQATMLAYLTGRSVVAASEDESPPRSQAPRPGLNVVEPTRAKRAPSDTEPRSAPAMAAP